MKAIERYFGSFRKSQRKTMAALASGLLMAGRLGLASIARGMNDFTTVRHRIKRAWRFASNKRIRTRKATGCLVDWLLRASRGRPVVALDWTDISRRRVMLLAAACVGRRAVPLAWTVMGRSQFSKKRRSRNDAEEQLIGHLIEAFGGREWVLVADRGFARADLFRKLKQWGVGYVIHACGNPWVEAGGFCGRLYNVPRAPGQVRLWRTHHRQLRRRPHAYLRRGQPGRQ